MIENLNTYIINLDTRPDRWATVSKQVTDLGITDFKRLPACTGQNPLAGNAMSHLSCLQQGANLIFEDDVFFEPGAMELFKKALTELPKDFHVLYLGGNVEKPINRISEHLFKLEHTWGSNAIYYSEAGRKYILDNYRPFQNKFEIYDVWLRRNCSLNLKAYIVYPILTWSHGGYSDVNKRMENYLPNMKQNAKMNMAKIPKRMFFYWGGVMSWMRYMTIYSFRKFNPDWEMVLYLSDKKQDAKHWNGWEQQDYFAYKGIDYTNKLAALNIRIENVTFDGSLDNSKLGFVAESDIFRYYQLWKTGGFYCDMDVLFFKPIEEYYKRVCRSDAVIHQDKNNMTIGMMASAPGNQLFKDLFNTAANGVNQSDYQSMGVLLFYKMFRGNGNDSQILDKIKSKYKCMDIQNLPTELIYHYDWSKVDQLFTNPVTVESFGKLSIGYHWYGGNPVSQKFNNILNENTYLENPTTYSEVCKSVLNTQPRVAVIIPVYNRPEYLSKTLQSLIKCLNQNVYVILTDDGSTDPNIARICNSFMFAINDRGKYLRHQHEGVFASMRKAFELCKGFETIITLDSDFIVKPNFITTLVNLLKLKGGENVIVTGFNASSHEVIGVGKSFIVKKSIGGGNLCITFTTYKRHIEPNLVNNMWDWNMVKSVVESNGTFVCSSPSVCQHIGMNSTLGHVRADVALDFQMETV